MFPRLLNAYRSTGADPPFADPARAHGTAMEGYYWRIVHPGSGSVIVALCGVCRGPDGPWATVAVAADPGGFTRHALVAPAAAEPSSFGARAAAAFCGSTDRLSIQLGEEDRVEVVLRPTLVWPGRVFGALGLAHALPGLGQYWHPVVLAARADGEASLGGVHQRLDGATAYAEKNWGPGFARHWWWGHADAFPGDDATVAFAGGRVGVAGRVVSPTAVVVRLGTRVFRFAPPLAGVHAAVTPCAWRIRARSPRHTVEIEGDAAGSAPHLLPVPDVAARRVDMRSTQYLAGRLRLRVRRGRHPLFEGESPLAGLELGTPLSEFSASPRNGPRP